MNPPLERGRACSRCRRRKMRCDGQRPACAQCVRAERSDDCEYLDGPGPTQNQMLEGQIAILEGRINDLMANSAPMTLHDPYAVWNQAQRHAQQSASDPTRNLVRDFVQHAREFGFFLDIHRFLDQVYTRGSRSNSLTILLNVVYLLGAKLSANPQVQTQEQSLLSRALQYLPRALPEDRGGAMYVMQAEVLLANYFFNGNRQLEGMYHTNAAVSIAMTFNLHLIRSNRRCRSAAEASRSLPPPVDTLEEGERINGFWTVFVLDRCWAIASGSAPAFTDDEAAGTQIDTPWPMDLSAYQAHPFPGDFRTSKTVQSFVAGATSAAHSTSQSILATAARAAVLYEMATRLASRYNPSSQGTFLSLDNRIQRFRESLPRLERLDPSRTDAVRSALLAHTLAQCASIQLHTPLVQDRVTANSRTYEAAHAAADNLRRVNIGTFGCVNPFMGILWGSVAKVISQGIATSRRLRAAGASASAQNIPADEATLQRELTRILTAMDQNAGPSPLMRAQVASFYSPRGA